MGSSIRLRRKKLKNYEKKIIWFVVHMYIIFAVFGFEKWRAIRASVGGVGGVLVWVAWVAC